MAELLGIQVIGSLFGIFMVYYSFLQYKRKEISGRQYILWLTLWVIFILVAIFPGWLDPFTARIGFIRTFDFLVLVGFMFLTGLLVYTYAKLRKTQSKLEELVRKIAIQTAKKQDSPEQPSEKD